MTPALPTRPVFYLLVPQNDFNAQCPSPIYNYDCRSIFFPKVSVVVCFSCLLLLVRIYWMFHLVKGTVDQTRDLEIFPFFFDMAIENVACRTAGRKLHSEMMSASCPRVLTDFCLWKYTRWNVWPTKWENGRRKPQTLFLIHQHVSSPPYCTNLFFKKTTKKQANKKKKCEWEL